MNREIGLAFAAMLFVVVAACGDDEPAVNVEPDGTLTVGFGLTSGENPGAGIQQAVRNVVLEGLVDFASNGRPRSWLAEKWSSSPDGLTWRIALRPGAKFHDGNPVTAAAVREILATQLPQQLGPGSQDIRNIEAPSNHEIEIHLTSRSAFLLEGLEFPIQRPGASLVGTGPFYADTQSPAEVEMRANKNYYGGQPSIERIVFKPYSSVRAAWADLLRGQVDMLYEVGVDALDLLQPSTETKVFTFHRSYAYAVILNIQRPYLRDSAFRKALNDAIDRDALVKEVLRGHGTPADGPVWPYHWAYDPQLPKFKYQPSALPGGPYRFTCVFADASLERLALTVQKQLQAIGVELAFELLPIDQALAKVAAGEFDAFLADAGQGPTLVRPYLFWYSGSPYNWGRFNSREVDSALDTIRHAANDEAYKSGVAAFQRAVIADPPAIFLAWSERARAVSTRFDVPVEPGRDILSTLRLWRPIGDQRLASRN